VEKQTELVGSRLPARGAVGSKVQFVRPDFWPGQRNKPSRTACWATWQIGDNEAGVSTLRTGLDAGEETTLDVQLFDGIPAAIIPAADLLSLAGEPAERSFLSERADLAQQHWVAGEAEDVADTLTLASSHGLRPAIMTKATAGLPPIQRATIAAVTAASQVSAGWLSMLPAQLLNRAVSWRILPVCGLVDPPQPSFGGA
jgi:hypothetical protein